MVDRKQLLNDLKPLLKALEVDLRARCDEVAEIGAGLQREYEQARAAGRCGVTFEEWRADLITQVAAAWILSCVFVRFLEDNALIAPPRISGPLHGAGDGAGLMRARDEREQYFKSHPKETDRDYLLAVFDELAHVPGTKDVFGPHNPVSAYRQWLSGDAAQKLIEFFQRIDADGTGELVHDFTDPAWDTRFLGDLYQDLSEAARKKYALLQTPIFVEEFILERTLEPAINEFGLAGFKMIDCACGSGHFVLGSFARVLSRWRRQEPGTPDRELVNRALAAVHGVDLNPYAVAIARFRLLIAAMGECHITHLKDLPAFRFNLVCGDSLLHGSPGSDQQLMGFHELAHAYQSEDLTELRRILAPGQYHAAVANPPYITVTDDALNASYRSRFSTCHRTYSLVVPFIERLFQLTIQAEARSGLVGMIIANSFMKAEFGKKLIEKFIPTVDLTHVIDTAGTYIPGHGTPTAILLGRSRRPIANRVRVVMGVRGEPGVPADPSKGLVWTDIVCLTDCPGETAFVSSVDFDRTILHTHPWSLGGGGASQLKQLLDSTAARKLQSLVEPPIGRAVRIAQEDVFMFNRPRMAHSRVPAGEFRGFLQGELVRDWTSTVDTWVWYPYAKGADQSDMLRQLWPWRNTLGERVTFQGNMADAGLRWFDYQQHTASAYITPLSIAYAFVASTNHFVLDRGGQVFKQSVAVVKLRNGKSMEEHLGVLGALNSSVVAFWMKQVCFPKGGDQVGDEGARVRKTLWDVFYNFNSNPLLHLPLPSALPTGFGELLDSMGRELIAGLPNQVLERAMTEGVSALAALKTASARARDLRARMVGLQEELDWECYGSYGLLADAPRCEQPPALKLGQRTFEIVLARRMAAGDEETTWFCRHGSTPITDIPAEWPEQYKQVVQRRIEIIESDRNIALIERPEYKRRWNTDPWEEQEQRALRNWLLDRLERHFDLDGRMNDEKQVTAHATLRQPRLVSVGSVADIVRQDRDFMQVAELYVGRMDFDIANLVGELIAAESVPALPVLRYKPAGLDKRAAWERTWGLQRAEDAIDAIFDSIKTHKMRRRDEEERLKQTPWLREFVAKPEWARVEHELKEAAAYVAEAVKQNLNLEADTVAKPLLDAARRAKQAVIGDIPVPPKYISADFLSSDVWRLRGKLDVPKERWVSFPHCEGEDGTVVIAWAGYDHLQLARAIAERYEHAKEHEGRKLVPLLAAIGQLIPGLKQWHNDLDPAYGTRMGDYFENYLAEEAKALGKSVAEVMSWTPPERVTARTRRMKAK